jgi:hypothetical protein
LLYFGFLTLAFVAAGAAQHWFVHRQFIRTIDADLASTASEVVGQIVCSGTWDMRGYENAVMPASMWYVVSRDGLIVDIEAANPRLFESVTTISNSIFQTPSTIISSIGEPWRLLGKKVDGGYVVVGIPFSSDNAESDRLLRANIVRFGSTIASASAIARTQRQIDDTVEDVVVGSDGTLVAAEGGVPLKTDLSHLPVRIDRESTASVHWDGAPFRLYSEPIIDKASNEVTGAVIVPKDLSLDERALDLQDKFNNYTIIASFGVTLLLTGAFAGRDWSWGRRPLSVEQALLIGESKTIEFKSSYQWDGHQQKQNKELRLKALKSIAGFLNGDGGNLLMGVEEDKSGHPNVCGLSGDLDLLGCADKLRLDLHNLITDRLGAEFSPFITDRIEEVRGNFCWVVSVERSRRMPAFVRWKNPGESKERERFFVREGPKTSELDTKDALNYIRQRWS